MDGEPVAQVEFGSEVELELIGQMGSREPLVVTIVSEQAADMDHGLLSEQAPLAKAILGRSVGSEAPYRFADIERVKILSARRPATPVAGDAAARRQATLEKAIRDAERTNAEMFASSFSGKWGDYDPEGLAQWEDQ